LSVAGNEVRQLTLGTAQSPVSPFPTVITFTSIPSWAKRITLIFNNVSTSGTANYLIQLADSGGAENTGYASIANDYGGGVASVEGFIVTRSSITAIGTVSGTVSIYNAFNSNLWISSGAVGSNSVIAVSTGSKTLSSTLTGLNILTVGGTNTFDAGSINIMYEG
jgi:hypothetical protein